MAAPVVSGYIPLFLKDSSTGKWYQPVGIPGTAGIDGADGAVGPPGPPGPTGVSSVIVGSFGSLTTPADLPPTGLIPVDWDGPGNPPVAYQMVQGQSLYYDKPTDPLDGYLFQFVGISIDPAGWLNIGLIQGPPGIQGEVGPEGPMTDEVFIGPDLDPVANPNVQLFFDTDDERILGPVDMPPGGITGQGMVKKTDLDGDVEWAGPFVPYVVPIGKLIQFASEIGAKIQLYGTTFGIGVESSTTTIWGSGNIKFRQNSLTGTEWANISSAVFSTSGSVNPGTYVLVTGSNATNLEHYFCDSIDNNSGTYFTVLEGRRLDCKSCFKIKGYQGALEGSNVCAHMKVYVTYGDDGELEIVMFMQNGAGGPVMHVHGEAKATAFTVASAMASKTDVAPLDPRKAASLIDSLHPITYRRSMIRGEGATRDPVPTRHVGFAVEGIEAAGIHVDELINGSGDDRGWDVPGLLAMAVSEIQQLRKRVAQLEAVS